MIKRRFFRVEHADGNDASDTSSSSSSDSDSDSEVEEEHLQETEPEDSDDDVQDTEHKEPPSGYESEDNSTKEVEDKSSDESQSEEEGHDVNKNKSFNKPGSRITKSIKDTVAEKDSQQFNDADYILKSKSVSKCRLCPKIICLTEESLNTHLKSKRHARSTKLLKEGRLKLMLNSDGEVEEDGETHAERLARTAAAAQKSAGSNKKNKGKHKGRQRQRNRLKKKKEDNVDVGKAKPSTDIPPKKRLKESKNKAC